jgi:hypothetical protein
MLMKLIERWGQIAGAELAIHTRPIGFTGSKRRRLDVAANPGIAPPWGDWNFIRQNPGSFAAFRKGINEVLAPFAVDHIFFDVDKWERSGTT